MSASFLLGYNYYEWKENLNRLEILILRKFGSGGIKKI